MEDARANDVVVADSAMTAFASSGAALAAFALAF